MLSSGKKVFLSIGGGGTHSSATSQANAEDVAFTLWSSYANPSANSGATPFFANAFVKALLHYSSQSDQLLLQSTKAIANVS